MDQQLPLPRISALFDAWYPELKTLYLGVVRSDQSYGTVEMRLTPNSRRRLYLLSSGVLPEKLPVRMLLSV